MVVFAGIMSSYEINIPGSSMRSQDLLHLPQIRGVMSSSLRPFITAARLRTTTRTRSRMSNFSVVFFIVLLMKVSE